MIAFDFDHDQDGLNRLATIKSDGSALQIIDPTPGYPSTLNDHWAGSWTPDGNNLLFTDVQLQISGNQIYIANATIRTLCLNPQSCYNFESSYNTYSFSPDIENSDPFSPTSQVSQLAPYSRIQKFIVKWHGVDVGPSGIDGYDVQYRREQDTEWQPWLTNAYNTEATPANLSPGRWYFQSRAKDRAGNQEPWPVGLQGDVSTTLYAWNLHGRYTDARGNSINGNTIAITPNSLEASSQVVNGQYRLKLGQSADFNFNSTSTVHASADQEHNDYEHPANNLIVNGGFEEQVKSTPSHWLLSAPVTQSLLMTLPFEGKNSLHLGYQCLFPCLGEGLQKSHGQFYSSSTLIEDNEGNVHVFTPYYTQGLNYQRYTIDGIWDSSYQMFNSSKYDDINGVYPIFDNSGRLHVVVMTDGSPLSQRLYYTRKTAAGIFLSPMALGYSSTPRIAFDASNNLHIVYLKYPEGGGGLPSLYYRVLKADGTLSTGQMISALNDVWGYDLVVEPSGIAHIYWSRSGYPQFAGDLISHTILKPGGSQSTVKIYQGTGRITQITIQSGLGGHNHIFWQEGSSYHWVDLNKSQWEDPYLLYQVTGDSVGYASPQFLRQGNQLYWFLTSQFGYEGVVRTFDGVGSWSDPQPVDAKRFAPIIALNHGSNRGFLGLTPVEYEHFYSTSQLAKQNESFSASQTISIPTTMHQPTLSFMYHLQEISTTNSTFAVSVSTSVSTTQIFDGSKNTNSKDTWQLGWADLNKWKGESITVTFAVQQAISDTYLQVELDAISVGPWTTPQLQDATPTKIDSPTKETLHIVGVNFLATPTVRLGENTLTDITWLNENEIQATVPVKMPPGIYQITVVNPDGQSNTSLFTIAVGKQVYLPLVSR